MACVNFGLSFMVLAEKVEPIHHEVRNVVCFEFSSYRNTQSRPSGTNCHAMNKIKNMIDFYFLHSDGPHEQYLKLLFVSAWYALYCCYMIGWLDICMNEYVFSIKFTVSVYIDTQNNKLHQMLSLSVTYISLIVVYRGVGCIFYEMITGRPLFPGSTVEDELHLIFRILGKECVHLYD